MLVEFACGGRGVLRLATVSPWLVVWLDLGFLVVWVFVIVWWFLFGCFAGVCILVCVLIGFGWFGFCFYLFVVYCVVKCVGCYWFSFDLSCYSFDCRCLFDCYFGFVWFSVYWKRLVWVCAWVLVWLYWILLEWLFFDWFLVDCFDCVWFGLLFWFGWFYVCEFLLGCLMS